MKYCMKCGVSVDETKNRVCPLCETLIFTDHELDELTHSEYAKIKIKPEQKENHKVEKVKEKKNVLSLFSFVSFLSSLTAILILLIINLAISLNVTWSLIPILSILLYITLVNIPLLHFKKSVYSVITFDAVVLVLYFLLLDILISHTISWSYYVVLSIILVWVYLTTLLVTKIKGFILKITIDFFATALFVLFVTLGYDQTSGFSKLALPINGLVFLVTVISYLFIKTYIYNWRMIIITLSINVSILCFGVDLIIQNYLHHQLTLEWSFIVLLVLIPLSLFMIYLDNQFKIHRYLMRKFHI